MSLPPSAPAPAPRRVLVVEDDPDGREALRLLLCIMGYEVEVASDGMEAVRKGVRTRPDVVVIDVVLPRLGGCDVAELLRAALGEQVLLVAYSAYDAVDLGRRLEETDFDSWLISRSRPFAPLPGGGRG
jgi:two-component system response regulator MprA